MAPDLYEGLVATRQQGGRVLFSGPGGIGGAPGPREPICLLAANMLLSLTSARR